MVITISIDVLAFTVFKDKIRLTALRYACINQFCNQRMKKQTENFAVPRKPFGSRFPHQRDGEEFHCNLALEPAVNSLRQPDAAHSALADLRQQSVRTNRLVCQIRNTWQFNRTPLQKAFSI